MPTSNNTGQTQRTRTGRLGQPESSHTLTVLTRHDKRRPRMMPYAAPKRIDRYMDPGRVNIWMLDERE